MICNQHGTEKDEVQITHSPLILDKFNSDNFLENQICIQILILFKFEGNISKVQS